MDLGVYSVLVLPREAAARQVARELSDAGHRSVAVRANPGGTLWHVASVAVYPAPQDGPGHLVPFVLHQKRGLAALARTRGGALLTHVYSPAGGVPGCSRDGLVHEDATARITVPDPMPGLRPRPPAAPRWEGLEFGDPGTEIGEAVAVAKRMYGTRATAPDLVAFLLDDAYAEEIDEPGEDTREFLADLVRSAHQMPTRDAGAVLIIPYLAELARSRTLSPAARTSLLQVLLVFAAEVDASTAEFADWRAMGGDVDLRRATALRDAAVAEIPGLVPLWDRESDAARLVLTSLATFSPARTAPLVLPRLPDLPAPRATDRADALALAAALLTEDSDALDQAMRQLAAWDDKLAGHLESPHTPRPEAARAALAAYVERDLPDAVKLP
ncbi:hypothetical protein ACFW1A_15455 [Kitasatospora sp. NPDC058965]|uniref:hypothetical protein n=1 Tax=Kitasatospora sp. NPDC058965 TaxID=3346682 RepID=UPI0036C9020F